ncbi:MAG: cell wall hydrolase [Pseudomonadota bacterium]
MREIGKSPNVPWTAKYVTPVAASAGFFFTFTATIGLQDASAIFTTGLDRTERFEITTAALSKIQNAASLEALAPAPSPVGVELAAVTPANDVAVITDSATADDATKLAERLGLRLPAAIAKGDRLISIADIESEVREVSETLGTQAVAVVYPTSNAADKSDPIVTGSIPTASVGDRFESHWPVRSDLASYASIATDETFYTIDDAQIGFGITTGAMPMSIEKTVMREGLVLDEGHRFETDANAIRTAQTRVRGALLASLPAPDQDDIQGDFEVIQVAMPIPRDMPSQDNLVQLALATPQPIAPPAALREAVNIATDADEDFAPLPNVLPKAVYAALLPRPKVPENIARAEKAIASLGSSGNALKDWKRGGNPDRSKRLRLSRAQRHCLAEAIYFEARGESRAGQKAVAQVVVNRMKSKHWPNTICGVVYQNKHWRNRCQFSFACDGKREIITEKKPWAVAKEIAQQFSDGYVYTPVKRATHYHATYVRPRWARYFNRIDRVGTHIFYRSRTGGWS